MALNTKEIATPHIKAMKGDFSKNLIFCGDPLRAKYIAENILKDSRLINNIRNMMAYTGTYEGKQISVMGHGMGMPSMSIFAHELYAFFGVENIVRVGTIGGLQKGLKLGDIIVADKAVTNSNFLENIGYKDECLASKTLLYRAVEKGGSAIRIGTVLTSDVFYGQNSFVEDFKKKGAIGVEMETCALYAEAKMADRKALAMYLVSDIVGSKKAMSADQRQSANDEIVKLALEIVKDL